MNLNYILLGLDYNTYINIDNELRYEFQQRTNFINDFFSKAIRKYKFETDGSFNMINVSLTEFEITPTLIVPSNVLQVYLTFDRKEYEKIKKTEDCNYYLELLAKGFRRAYAFKSIPLEILLNLIEEFKKGGCKNEWLHKKKKFKEYDLEVVLTCEFTTNYFQLWVSVNQLSTKTNLIRDIIIRTETGVSIHEGMFKNILIDKDIIITDKSDSPRIIINKEAVFDGKLEFTVNGDTEMKKILSYEL